MTGPVWGGRITILPANVKTELIGKKTEKFGRFLLFTCSANLGKIPPALTPLATGRGAAACVGGVIGEIPAVRHGRPFLRKEC